MKLALFFFLSVGSCALSAADGQGLFEQHCALCHGIGGTGGRGPNLARPKLVNAPDDAALKTVITEGIDPEMPGAWFLPDEDVAAIAAYVRALGKLPAQPLPGDPKRGAQLYAARGCAACHTLAGNGVGYGPDLTEIGARRSAGYIGESLVKPAAAVPEGFLLLRVRTTAGKIMQGVRLNETTFTIHTKDAQGNPHSFRKSDLAAIEKLRGQTPMPAYDRSLTAPELQDLVAYLASQRGDQ